MSISNALGSFNVLPPEMVMNILTHLPKDDHTRIDCVSKDFLQKMDAVWELSSATIRFRNYCKGRYELTVLKGMGKKILYRQFRDAQLLHLTASKMIMRDGCKIFTVSTISNIVQFCSTRNSQTDEFLILDLSTNTLTEARFAHVMQITDRTTNQALSKKESVFSTTDKIVRFLARDGFIEIHSTDDQVNYKRVQTLKGFTNPQSIRFLDDNRLLVLDVDDVKILNFDPARKPPQQPIGSDKSKLKIIADVITQMGKETLRKYKKSFLFRAVRDICEIFKKMDWHETSLSKIESVIANLQGIALGVGLIVVAITIMLPFEIPFVIYCAIAGPIKGYQRICNPLTNTI